MTRILRIAVIGMVLAVLVLPSESVRRAPDLMGSYCASRPPRSQCCRNRADNCAVPLMGTKCYCDQFCNHGYNEDCCPDYWEVCLGETAKPPETLVRLCHFEGRQYHNGDTFTSNCNTCTCVDGSRQCDLEVCVADQPLLDLLRRMRPSLGWTAANYTFFWGRKLSEALLRRGGTPHPHGAISLAAKNTAVMRANGEPVPPTPEYFDARAQWPGLVGDIADQGWCDTAWALTTASVASDRLAIQTRGARRDRLSPQELIDCSRSLQNGCDTGGHLDRAWNYMRRKGISPESCYQWTGSQDKCRARPGRCKPYKTGPVYPLPGEELIRYDIYTSGPVQATMKLYRDFFSYRSGIYRRSPESKSHRTGFHVVKIVGWGEENGEKYWIAANSWGPTWGEKGYFRIVRGSNECEIENFVFAAWGPPLGNFTTRSPATASDMNEVVWD